MGMGKFGQGDPTKTQHQISSSNTGTHHLAGNLVIEGDLSVSGSYPSGGGGSARSVAGDTDNGIITWKTSDNTFIVESGVLITADGNISGSGKGYFEKDVEIADNLLVSGSADVAGQLSVGPSNAEGVIASRGDQDLKLKTGNSTTGVITITDGSNGDITFSPNGTGDVVADGILKPNDGINVDKGSAGAVTVNTPGDPSNPHGTVTGMETQRAGTFVATMDSGFTFSNDSVISIQVANNLVVSTDVIAVTATVTAQTGILAGCIAIAPSSNFFRIGLHNVGGGAISPSGTVTVNWVIL